ncbi:WW domain-binding protein 4-like [Papaver somniferum]|uniref:WW domain-binding protein 4-like n=1 Tax=Papaver somniferum TaxID=3469 RepID=UPI000E703D38|nr:WW domain-binding protein 4-like [Papaver somniferum]
MNKSTHYVRSPLTKIIDSCTIVELPTKVKSKQEHFLPELVKEELDALPEYSKQRPKARGTLKEDTGKGTVASPNKLEMKSNQANAVTRLLPGWAEAKDPATGSSYYYHVSTRKSQWEIPSENFGSAQPLYLPPQQDWIETLASGCRYYYNTKTGVSQWEVPESLKKVPLQHNKETASKSTVNKNGQSPFFMQIKCMGCGGWGLDLVQAWG